MSQRCPKNTIFLTEHICLLVWRLSKDYEHLSETRRRLPTLLLIRIMVRRLAQGKRIMSTRPSNSQQAETQSH